MSGARGVLVTGGTGALGRAIVKRLLEQGARVAVTYRREAEWRTLESAAAAPGRLHGVEADLADAEAARRAVETAAAELGVLDGLALVAGGWAGGTAFDAAPADEWSRMLRGNLDSAAYACRHALRITPNDLVARRTLARVYYLGGAYSWSAAEWRRVLAAAPKDREARAGLKAAESHRARSNRSS